MVNNICTCEGILGCAGEETETCVQKASLNVLEIAIVHVLEHHQHLWFGLNNVYTL